MDGQTDKRMIGCVDRQIDEWMARYMTQENGWVDGWINEWMDGQINGREIGWMNG